MIQIQKNIVGDILDIGGGGEGVISGVYGHAVVAIDSRREELDELPYACRKIVMDASALEFPDASFENITAFYAFLFIEKAKHPDVVREAFRVLRPGGHFYIWDTAVDPGAALPFLKDLLIRAGGREIRTTYGVAKRNPEQNAAYFRALFRGEGFLPREDEKTGTDFYQHWTKPRE